MIPLRDANPSGSKPIVSTALIGANVVVFVQQLLLGPRLNLFIAHYGLVPARAAWALTHPVVGLKDGFVVPLLAHMFLHGGWLHLAGNMWYLWLFGDNVEDRIGHLRFLLFYLFCGAAAGIVQMLVHPLSSVPIIGASGAIAGVLGAYMLCFPYARILTLVPILFFFQFVELPAFAVLFLWFVLQFFSGTMAITTQASGGVAWWAHVGGFIAGMLVIRRLPRCRSSRQRHYRTWFDQ